MLFLLIALISPEGLSIPALEAAKATTMAECERMRTAEVEAVVAWDGQPPSPLPALAQQRERACAKVDQVLARLAALREAERGARAAAADQAAAGQQLMHEVRRDLVKAEAERWRQIQEGVDGPQCKSGKRCGQSCIAKSKTCHK